MNRRDPLAGLHVFRQVADTGSFTRAAALLGVTPAAVSQAINQLEAELRLKLFHRTTRGVSLSEAGQRYHEQTEQPYRDLVRAREALGESLAEPSGQLRISALHLAKNLVIAPMLNEFVRRYPKVQLEIRYEDQLVDIVRERLDAGIRLADALQPGMVGVQLTAPLACLLVATPAYLAEYGTPASVADLDGHAAVRFRFPRSGRLHKWRLREDGRELEVDLPARFVSTDTEAIIEAARAGFVATSIAEYFRDQGRRVLLLMDSLTRFARAQREIGLAAGEPPTRRGYPPSVFAALPRLMERAGQSERGSITALYTVLVEGDDMSEPVADETRSILDGHIVLSRKLAAANHYPAIDVLHSVSRVMNQIVDDDQRHAAGRLREWLAKYEEVELLLKIGEYQKGQDSEADRAIEKIGAIRQWLRQGTHETSDYAQACAQLRSLCA